MGCATWMELEMSSKTGYTPEGNLKNELDKLEHLHRVKCDTRKQSLFLPTAIADDIGVRGRSAIRHQQNTVKVKQNRRKIEQSNGCGP